MRPLLLPLLAALLLPGCDGDKNSPADSGPPPEQPEAAPAPAHLRRLSVEQYQAALTSLFGEGLILPSRLEPDQEQDGLIAVGNAINAISSRGVEQYEDAAFYVAGQLTEDPERLAALLPCNAEADPSETCYRALAEDLGLKAWRRPLSEDELTRLVTLATTAESTLGSLADGVSYLLAGLLQSPNFIYRVELGEPDPDNPGLRRLTDYELASRLSFTLWNQPPDDTLLAAAAAGELTAEGGLEAQAQRLLDDPRAAEGLRSFFTDLLELDDLDTLSKDPFVFEHTSEEVGPSAREETLLGVEHIFNNDDDFRSFYTTRTAFLDRRLSSIYEVAAPAREGFAETELPDGPRAGYFGQASFLALQAHAVSTSATLRGKFVREMLLCQPMAPPPADADTSIPEPSPDSPTLRERLSIHLEVESCAGCHVLMDPIGLGFEQFDGIGRFRTTENDALIDPSGALDGDSFADARGLGRAVSEHKNLGPCLTETYYRWALGHSFDEEEEVMVDWLSWGFVDGGHSLRQLMLSVVLNPHFRLVGEVEG